MEVIGLIQGIYIKHIQEEQEKANKKTASGGHRARRFRRR
jgi:peptide subunit release factor 1 (eRF1)